MLDDAWMRLYAVGLTVFLMMQPCLAAAQVQSASSVTPTRQLRGLTPDEASLLIAKIGTAQQKLKAGTFENFELLSGSIASYEMTKVPPRDAFLAVPFDQVWKVERVRSENPLWQPYRLAYAPNGLGQLYWDITVTLNSYGDVQQVLMTYRPPAPF